MKTLLILIYARFFPVYWKQDNDLVNNGWDILSISQPDKYYFYGTLSQYQKCFFNFGGKK